MKKLKLSFKVDNLEDWEIDDLVEGIFELCHSFGVTIQKEDAI